jgi:hypothetical protein
MLKSKKFWSYDACQTFDFKQENLENYKSKGRIYDDFVYFYEFIGIGTHPSIKVYGRDISDPYSITFLSTAVDVNTLKILFALLPNTRVVTLKFSNNEFDQNNLDFLINSLLNKPNNIYNFIYEWNSKVKIDNVNYEIGKDYSQEIMNNLVKTQQLLGKLTTSSRIEALCLRGNYFGDDTANYLFENLKNNQFLRVLNLYKNNLTSKCINEFNSMIEMNKKLEEINLGANHFKNNDLNAMKDGVGKFPMAQDHIEIYHKKIKERDAVIEKNKKLKAQKKPEEPLPNVEEITLIGDTYYTVKNTTLKSLNLMQNNFTETCFEDVINILDSNADFMLTIDGKIFSKTDKEKLTDPFGKYVSRVYLTK